MNSNFNKYALAVFLMVGFGAKAIPTPEAVEPQLIKTITQLTLLSTEKVIGLKMMAHHLTLYK